MASEIKVDTISEKTAANGVTIDGVNIKDSALATAGSVPLTTIDIDGGTDIGAAIVDADLFIIDDGAGGTNRKVTASRIKTYAGGAVTAINNATANELVTIGSTTTELDAEANLTFDGTDVLVGGAGKVQLRDTGLYIASNADGDLDIVSDGTAVDSINLESAGGITLDAGTDSSGIVYEDDGTEMLRIHNSSSDVYIESKVSDKDIYLRGNDGGSGVNALKLDMSDAGAATLNNGLTLTAGNLTVASGAGINFAATGDGSGSDTSELLDDYEEGTWTPVIKDADDNAATMTHTSAGYTKIGRLCWVGGYIGASPFGSMGSSSQVRLTGLPYTAMNSDIAYSCIPLAYAGGFNTGAGQNVNWHVQVNTTRFVAMIWDDANGTSAFTTTMMNGSGDNAMIGGGCYITT